MDIIKKNHIYLLVTYNRFDQDMRKKYKYFEF